MQPHLFDSMLLRHEHLVRLAILLLAVACGPRPVERRTSGADPRACDPPPVRLPSPADTAGFCAEEFIARNGYTDLPPATDTTLIAFESIEWSASRPELLRERRKTLERHAVGICEPQSSRVPPAGQFIVAFRSRDTAYMRAVTMSARYADLRVQHQDFNASALDSAQYGCRRLPRTTTRLHN